MLLSRSERVLTCVTPASVTAHKFRDAGSEAAMGTVLTSLQRPGVGSRQPQSRSQASVRPARWVPLWGGCAAVLEWGGGLCLWVRNIGSEASLKKGLPFRPKFLKLGQHGVFHPNIPPAILFPRWRAEFSADDGAGGSVSD